MRLDIMMKPEDCMQIAILCLAETIFQQMLKRAIPKSRRANQLQHILEKIENVNETFDGHLPDSWITKSDTFNASVEDLLVKLLQDFETIYESQNPSTTEGVPNEESLSRLPT